MFTRDFKIIPDVKLLIFWVNSTFDGFQFIRASVGLKMTSQEDYSFTGQKIRMLQFNMTNKERKKSSGKKINASIKTFWIPLFLSSVITEVAKKQFLLFLYQYGNKCDSKVKMSYISWAASMTTARRLL